MSCTDIEKKVFFGRQTPKYINNYEVYFKEIRNLIAACLKWSQSAVIFEHGNKPSVSVNI
jgi:hypothetical protein